MVVCPYCFASFEIFDEQDKTIYCIECNRFIHKYDEARGLIHFIWGRVKNYDPEYDMKVKNKLIRLAELIESIPHKHESRRK